MRHRLAAVAALAAVLVGAVAVGAGRDDGHELRSGAAAVAAADGSQGVDVETRPRATSPTTTSTMTSTAVTATTTPPRSGPTAAAEPASPTDPVAPGTDPAMPSGSVPVREVLVGSGPSPSPEGPTGPIGAFDTSGYVPEGLDLAALPDVVPGPAPQPDGPTSISPGPNCAYQCIVSGIAYPRGFGAELVVQTRVPADLWMAVWADWNDDGEMEFYDVTTSPADQTEFSWALDGLEAGMTYHAMAVATDEHDDSSHAFGEFTTLSERDVEISIDEVEIDGGPTNLAATHHYLRVDGGALHPYDLGAQWTYRNVDRHVDVDLVVAREWTASLCEGLWLELFVDAFGDSDASCAAWNTATTPSIDLDQVPAKNRWTSVSFTAVARSPNGVGAAAPRWFDAAAYVSVTVRYR